MPEQLCHNQLSPNVQTCITVNFHWEIKIQRREILCLLYSEIQEVVGKKTTLFIQDFFFSVYKVLANEIIEIIAEIFRGGLIVKPVEKTVTPTCQLIRELIRDKSSTALRNWDFLTDTVSSTGVLPSSFFIIAHTKAADVFRVVYLQEYIKQHKNFSSYAKLNNILEDCQVWPISLSRDLLLF